MSIQVCNLQSGEIVTYSLPLLVGEVTPPLGQATVVVRHAITGHTLAWPVHNGQFKALVQLQPGENKIQFRFYGNTVEFILHYQVPNWTRFVRPLYLIAADDDGHFQGPSMEDRSPASAMRRIALAAKMLQTFTAEKLHEHGLGRRTFVLESDLYPERSPCMVFKSRIKVADAFKMTGGDLWMYFAKELMSSRNIPDKENCKWFAFISFTRYQPPEGHIPKSHTEILKYTKGHTALGGGGLALFGTGNLHTWAETLEDVSPCFTNTSKIDRTKFMDDSAYRQTYWANFSTGLGASLHELGHTFDLAHTPTGIMARGFDDIYKVFTVQPQTSSRGGSQEGSRLTSPGPYSPRQSPIHRSRIGSASSTSSASGVSNSRSSSPKPCPLSQPHPHSLHPPVPGTMESIDPIPAIIQIETAFKRVKLDSSQTMTVINYDGSETQRTIVKHRDGTETVTEVTLYPNGERVTKEMVKNLATGKTRTTMSMSASLTSHEASSSDSSSSSGSATKPSQLPRSPDEEGSSSTLNFQEVQYKDGGAHWYRASAIMLRYHKWFNAVTDDHLKNAPTLDGNVIESAAGLRLVELRSLPESMVIHHWEFLHGHPPTHFNLRNTELRDITQNATDVTVVAEDSHGNIMKKKVQIESLKLNGKSGSACRDMKDNQPGTSAIEKGSAKLVQSPSVTPRSASPSKSTTKPLSSSQESPARQKSSTILSTLKPDTEITLHVYHTVTKTSLQKQVASMANELSPLHKLKASKRPMSVSYTNQSGYRTNGAVFDEDQTPTPTNPPTFMKQDNSQEQCDDSVATPTNSPSGTSSMTNSSISLEFSSDLESHEASDTSPTPDFLSQSEDTPSHQDTTQSSTPVISQVVHILAESKVPVNDQPSMTDHSSSTPTSTGNTSLSLEAEVAPSNGLL